MNSKFYKNISGELFDAHDPDLLLKKEYARNQIQKYNLFKYNNPHKKDILRKLFGSIGSNVRIGAPFNCEYGENIYIGDNVSVNVNCFFSDNNIIEIGNFVLIGPGTQLLTAYHPINPIKRTNWKESSSEFWAETSSKKITIGDNVWLGAGCIILGGVTIGSGSMVGAGTVVTKNIPENSLAYGNPLKIIGNIDKIDR